MSQFVAGDQDGEKKSLGVRMKEKAKMPGIKDKVKNLKSKVHIPGMKHSGGGDDESSSDEQSPKAQDTDYNKGASTPYTTVNEESLSHDSTHNSAPPSSPPPRRAPPQVTTQSRDARHRPSSEKRVSEKSKMSQSGVQGTYVNSSSTRSGQPEQPATNQSPGSLIAVKDKIVGSASAAASVVGSKLGYYKDEDDQTLASTDYNVDNPQAGKTYGQQAADYWTGAKKAMGMEKQT